MMNSGLRSRVHWLRKGFLGVVAVLFLVLLSACGGGNAVHVYDNAGVLDTSRVQNEASSLPKPIDIYTVSSFNGTKADFNRTTASKLGNNPDLIVMAIDTQHHYLAIVGGKNVPLSNSQYNEAVSAFRSSFGNGDYTGATVAAVDSLRNSLGATSTAPGGGIFSGFLGALLCIGLIVLAVIVVGGFVARRRFMGAPRMGIPYQQPYNPGYPPGYPPNYYGPPYNQGPGINPWAAGGLGAAAGGLIGYELGKEAGEREGQEGQGGGNFGGGGGGDFGGGGGGDFGGGGSGNF